MNCNMNNKKKILTISFFTGLLFYFIGTLVSGIFLIVFGNGIEITYGNKIIKNIIVASVFLSLPASYYIAKWRGKELNLILDSKFISLNALVTLTGPVTLIIWDLLENL